MADGPTGPRRRRKRAEPAPTTPDPIEIAMEAEASGVVPEGVAHEVLRKQSQLLGWPGYGPPPPPPWRSRWDRGLWGRVRRVCAAAEV